MRKGGKNLVKTSIFRKYANYCYYEKNNHGAGKKKNFNIKLEFY